jgi:hypothetical protein
MAYMTNREFAEHEYKRQKRNAYADALAKEVRQLREENELLQAQLADYHHMSELVDGKMEENQRLRRINENLQAQLSASQRRADVAVEFIKYLDRNYSGYMSEDERFAEWRGEQSEGQG